MLHFLKKNKKGKQHVAMSLYRDGKSASSINRTCKSSVKSIDNWIASVDQGKGQSPEAFKGKTLSASDLSELYGACIDFIY